MSEEAGTTGKPSYEEQRARYDAHIDHRKRLEEALIEVSGRFTQWSLTLSGGALGLSITYVEKLTPALNSSRGLLIGAWALLAVSIVSNLFSLHCSGKATHKAIELSDQQLQNWRKDHTSVFADAVNTSSVWTAWLSMASLVSFSAGITLFCLFVYFCPPSARTDAPPVHHGHPHSTSATSITAPGPSANPSK